ncbi:hypothetical protein [Acidimangrovimonas sediminis]|nr:hypothetical protein [Acidimangrovimonas sediminis]
MSAFRLVWLAAVTVAAISAYEVVGPHLPAVCGENASSGNPACTVSKN